MSGIEIINQRVREESIFIDSIKQEVGKVIVGQVGPGQNHIIIEQVHLEVADRYDFPDTRG